MAAISGSSVNTEAPAPLASGLRAFFLLGSIHAAVVMVLWVPWFLGLVGLSSAFTPRVWHTYELLFGSFLAIVAGTLTTVMPGRARQGPMNGWLLAVLVALWLIARLAIGISGQLDERLTAAACLPFSVALACLIGRECIATRDWRDLGLAATLVGLAIAEALFHYEAWRTGRPKFAELVAVALAVLLVMIVSRRIIPGLAARRLTDDRRDSAPERIDWLDRSAAIVPALALASWAARDQVELAVPGRLLIGVTMLLAAALVSMRQVRSAFDRESGQSPGPIANVALLFVGLGFLLSGLGLLAGHADLLAAGFDAWATGAVGTMMLAIMTRLPRDHAGLGSPLRGGGVVLCTAIVLAGIMRVAASLFPQSTMLLLPLSGLAWIVAFAGYALLYGPVLLRARK